MIALLISGLLIGLSGSLHCLGMCGPLQWLVPTLEKGHPASKQAFISYHLGRITLYSALGLISGFIGLQWVIFNSFQWVSLILGGFMLILAWIGLEQNGKINQWIMKFLKGLLNKSYKSVRESPSLLMVFNIGLLNGLLPCGLVYFALLNALSSASVFWGWISMLFFGIGTLPVFIVMRVLSKKFVYPLAIRKLQPVLLTLVALMIILRGLNLGIPYLSPKIYLTPQHGVPHMECCEGRK